MFLTYLTIGFALLFFFDELLFNTPPFNRLAKFQSCRPTQNRVGIKIKNFAVSKNNSFTRCTLTILCHFGILVNGTNF